MSQEDNLRIVREFHASWNDREFDRGAALMAADGEILIVGSGERFVGPEGSIAFSRMWADGFPDSRTEITDTISEGDRIAVLYRGRGTHTGTLRNASGEIPATGKEVTLELCDVIQVRNGKVQSVRTYFDSGALLAQLGLMAAAPARATA
ncbi:MAG: ester cyclase [Actinomycetota bacterium]|nr:ester cyclase [Actinomycetota bacterium]